MAAPRLASPVASRGTKRLRVTAEGDTSTSDPYHMKFKHALVDTLARLHANQLPEDGHAFVYKEDGLEVS